MKTKYYLPSGYIDMAKIFDLPYTFIFVVHGRGTGKTFGACKYCYDYHDRTGDKFIYLRRLQTEADLVGNTAFSPFTPVTDFYDLEPLISGPIPNVKNVKGIWKTERNEKGDIVPAGPPIGYTAALATVSSIRGFSGRDIKVCVYDEFIPEKTARPIRAEGEAVLQFYESVNRNRELEGEPPLKMVFLSNANKLSSPVFEAFGITNYVDKMVRGNQEECYLKDRGVAILKLKDSPISQQKSKTALYKASQSEAFNDMAIGNAFDMSNYLYVRAEPIDEYRIIAKFDDVYIYRHKSDARYYVTRYRTGTPKAEYISEPFSIKKFKKDYALVFTAWIDGRISFNDYYCKLVLTKAIQ